MTRELASRTKITVLAFPRTLPSDPVLESVESTFSKRGNDMLLWGLYCRLVTDYSRRNFSYQEDVLPSMAGILNQLSLGLPFKDRFHLLKLMCFVPLSRNGSV